MALAPTQAQGAYANPMAIDVYMGNATYATTTYKIPSGESRYFFLKGDISGVITGTTYENLTVRLDGDASYATIAQAAGVTANFIWSPNSTSSSVGLNDLDYTNGYGLVGLPTTYMDLENIYRPH